MSLFACQTQNKKMNKPTLISATKSMWFGGREGVEGTNFNLMLKSEKKLIFEELVFEKNQKLKVAQTEKEGIYYLSSSWTVQPTEPTLSEDGKIKHDKVKRLGNKAQLFYHEKNTEKRDSISVEFESKDAKMYP